MTPNPVIKVHRVRSERCPRCCVVPSMAATIRPYPLLAEVLPAGDDSRSSCWLTSRREMPAAISRASSTRVTCRSSKRPCPPSRSRAQTAEEAYQGPLFAKFEDVSMGDMAWASSPGFGRPAPWRRPDVVRVAITAETRFSAPPTRSGSAASVRSNRNGSPAAGTPPDGWART